MKLGSLDPTDHSVVAMRPADVVYALETCVAQHLGIHITQDCPQAPLDDLGLDSFQAVLLSQDLVHRFDILIPPETLMLSSIEQIRQQLSVDPLHNRKEHASIDKSNASYRQVHARTELLALIAAAVNIEVKDLDLDLTFQQLGLDAFTILHLCQDIEQASTGAPQLQDISMQTTTRDILVKLGIRSILNDPPSTSLESSRPVVTQHKRFLSVNALAALAQVDSNFTFAAEKRGFLDYWANVAPGFQELFLAYTLEGFQSLGLNLGPMHCGTIIPEIPHLAKYNRLFQRLWEKLEREGVVQRIQNQIVRSGAPVPTQSAKELNALMEARHPSYFPETSLLGLIGPHFSACVTGKMDPISIMFGSPDAMQAMENFYADSPMMSTLTDQLVNFVSVVLKDAREYSAGPIRILEVGAGTGGTTVRLAEALDSLNVIVQYTFTDVSPGFVSQAKRKFKQYNWMDFHVLNLEKAVKEDFRKHYDIIIGANVVHATTDRIATCRRLKDMLRQGGFAVLSEITYPIDWYDICFGLLDGWWLAEGGKGYPIQSAEAWMSTFREAGFDAVGYSKGESLEENSQQLLVGCRSAENDE